MSNDAPPPSVAPGSLSETQIASLVQSIKHDLEHPDIVDRVVAEYAFTEWVRALAEAGLAGTDLNLPLTLSSDVTKDVKNDDGSFQQCEHHFIGIFGHELISWDSCQSGSGTGSGHSSGGHSTT